MSSKRSKKNKVKMENNASDDETDMGASVKCEVEMNELNIKQENEINDDADEHAEEKKAEITWPEEDLLELIGRMTRIIPSNDNLSYSTRLDRLDWEKVVFKDYTIDNCKSTWYLVQKHTRRYRLLNEILEDAKTWVMTPKQKRHPDLPRRPMSAYLCYYLSNRETYVRENPGLDAAEISKKIAEMYKKLSPEVKAQYDFMAAKSKEQYEVKMKDFIAKHPEVNIKQAQGRPVKEQVPKRPTPFNLFYYAELKKQPVEDKKEFRNVCKEKWKNLSDKKKMVWINYSISESSTYEEKLQKYKETHPEYKEKTIAVLSKEEVDLKNRLSGKPTKPPSSAYTLFSRELLNSEAITALPSKERLKYVSAQWRERTEEEKQHYRNLLQIMTEKYKSDYNNYLMSLSDEQRQAEIENEAKKQQSKKRKPTEDHNAVAANNVNANNAAATVNANVNANANTNANTATMDNIADTIQSVINTNSYSDTEESKTNASEIVQPIKKAKLANKEPNSNSKPKAKTKKQAAKVTVKQEPPPVVQAKKYPNEPVQPPLKAFKYFTQVYKGSLPAAQAWKALTSQEKSHYERELVKKKKQYIAEFEKFLNSLSKEDLHAYSLARNLKAEEEAEKEEAEEEEEEIESTTSSGEASSSEEED